MAQISKASIGHIIDLIDEVTESSATIDVLNDSIFVSFYNRREHRMYKKSNTHALIKSLAVDYCGDLEFSVYYIFKLDED